MVRDQLRAAEPLSPGTTPAPASTDTGATLSFDQLALRTAACGLAVTDALGTVLWVNPTFTTVTGYAAEDVVGLDFSRLAGTEDGSAFYRRLGAPEAVAAWKGELTGPTRDGVALVHEVTVTPVNDESGRLTHFVATVHNVTDCRRDEEQLRQLNADLARSQLELLETYNQLKQAQARLVQTEKLESIGRLAAGIAHEVKNPLAILLMGVSYLDAESPVKDATTAGVLTDMRDAIERADAIVRELLSFSSPHHLDLAPVALNEVVEHALVLVRHELMHRAIHVVRELAPGLPPHPMDRIKIEQVFVNLFMNAAHAMEGGGTLTVRTYPQDGQLCAEVLDTGTGINPAHLRKVFDPFFTTKPPGMGSGMGLAVARSIMTQHAGRLELGNRAEGGTRATMLFGAVEGERK